MPASPSFSKIFPSRRNPLPIFFVHLNFSIVQDVVCTLAMCRFPSRRFMTLSNSLMISILLKLDILLPNIGREVADIILFVFVQVANLPQRKFHLLTQVITPMIKVMSYFSATFRLAAFPGYIITVTKLSKSPLSIKIDFGNNSFFNIIVIHILWT